MYTEEQLKYIKEHLRKPEEAIATAEIAKIIAEEAYLRGKEVYPEQAWNTALIMNLGETNENISFIYDEDYSWKENDKVKLVNQMHGKISIAMAENIKIELTDEQKKAIESHSESNYANDLAQVIKLAEICEMTSISRIYDGEHKEPASSWEEVKEIILQDKNISSEFIEITECSYGKRKFCSKLTYKQKIALFAQKKDVLMKIPFIKTFVEKQLYALPPAQKESSAKIGKERLARVLRSKNLPQVDDENKVNLNNI